MTIDEYRYALVELDRKGKLGKLRDTWGGAKETVDKTVEAFASSEDPARWERIAIFRLEPFGISGLKTEDEKLMEAANRSARAAQDSATAAKWSARLAVAAVVVSVLTLIVSVFTTS